MLPVLEGPSQRGCDFPLWCKASDPLNFCPGAWPPESEKEVAGHQALQGGLAKQTRAPPLLPLGQLPQPPGHAPHQVTGTLECMSSAMVLEALPIGCQPTSPNSAVMAPGGQPTPPNSSEMVLESAGMWPRAACIDTLSI